jgi:hypothetical protein
MLSDFTRCGSMRMRDREHAREKRHVKVKDVERHGRSLRTRVRWHERKRGWKNRVR